MIETAKPADFSPWRRYLARMLDYAIYNVLWTAFLFSMMGMDVFRRSKIGDLVDIAVVMAMMLFIEPLLLKRFGTTIGKRILGLRLTYEDGERLSYEDGLARTFQVIGRGLGYSIPIYNLVCLWKSYKRSREGIRQPWDAPYAYEWAHSAWYQSVIYIGTVACMVLMIAGLTLWARIPPNRGDLTVAEFVQNFNHYADYYGIDFGNDYLDESGTWKKESINDDLYSVFTYVEKPVFYFTSENGAIREISFEIEREGSDRPVYSYDAYLVLSALAFAGAQEEATLFSGWEESLAAQIEDGTFQSFDFELNGIEFSCQVTSEGYMDRMTYNNSGLATVLLPEENPDTLYFQVIFTMRK
jgi:uncharacterized RDD family membrane protein YckC